MIAIALLLFQDPTLTLDDGARVTRVPSVRVKVKAAEGFQMCLTADEKTPPLWTPVREVTILDLPGGDGDKKIVLRLRNAQGVESAPLAANIRLDTTAPLPKVEAPERVAGSEVRAIFDVADAVALQYAEDLRSWSAWEPYATPKTLPLSRGAGPKAVFVRFRDEAGNESVPGRIVVEAQSAAASPPGAGFRSLVLGTRRVDFGLWLTLWMDAPGLTEARISLDGAELLARSPLLPRRTFEVARAEGPRRLLVTAWDAGGAEHRGELVFQDRDARAGTRDDLETEGPPSSPQGPWSFALLGGGFAGGVGFDAQTFDGRRKIEKGSMFHVRAEARLAPVYPLVLGLAAECSEGQDTRILSLGLDGGVRFDLGRLSDAELEAGFDVGVYYSKLDVDLSDFGDFQGGLLLRGGPRLGVRLTERLWAEVAGDFRWATYDPELHVLDGDDAAELLDIGVLAGISWRF